MTGADKPSPETTKPAASPMPPTPASQGAHPKRLDMNRYVERLNAEVLRRHPIESNPPK